MSKLEWVKIDSRGRIVLPQHFREFLGLKENDSAYATLDEQNHRLLISPAAAKRAAGRFQRIFDGFGRCVANGHLRVWQSTN